MKDPFADLTGNPEPLETSSIVEQSPFESLVVGSEKKRTRNRTILSLGIIAILLLGVWFVPRALNSDSVGDQVVADSPSLSSPSSEMNADESETESVTAPSEESLGSLDSGEALFNAPGNLEKFIETVTESTIMIECAESEEASLVDSGSGFVADLSELTGSSTNDLFVVTNHHVVENCLNGAGLLFVGLGNDFYESEVIGYDESNDLALIDSSLIPYASMNVSSDISLGQWVMTSGSPIDLQSNVTFGQVTSLGVPSESGGEDQVASDAVIGPGNSGGPLVDSRGYAIAVNSAYYVDAAGLSISVPIKYLCISILDCPGQ
jgi:S1-C subfamily serine protease